MLENLQFSNIITIADFPHNTDLKEISNLIYNQGFQLEDFDFCHIHGRYKNRVMDAYKTSINNTLWDSAVKMLITTQTSAPTGNESTPSAGLIKYTATSTDETARQQGNPYYIAYQITDSSANGQWGSLCWTTAADVLINRVRVSTNKLSGRVVFIELKAEVV